MLRRLRRIIETGQYQLIHCHTPIPSALTRLASRRWRRRGGKVIYTAHGFHFYRGGPIARWLTYYPLEWLLSGFTDAIVTINREDFGYVRRNMRHKAPFLIPGIGIDSSRFKPADDKEKARLRAELGYREADFIALYTAEFILRKNHAFIVDAARILVREIPNLKILFAGTGPELDRIQSRIQAAGLQDHVVCLGFREDVPSLAAISDVGVSSSRHEGLGLGIAEQMMCRVPVVATEDKGHRELIDHGVNGFLFPQGDHVTFCESLNALYSSPELRKEMGQAASRKAEAFRIERSVAAMGEIYSQLLS